VRVTASAGHHTAVPDLLRGRYDGLGLDFYDVHVYDDDGRIPNAYWLWWHARRRGVPIVLGEYGQKTERRDDRIQVRATRGFLYRARAWGFAGALAWRLDDDRTAVNPSFPMHHTYWMDGRPRPAVREVRRFAHYHGWAGGAANPFDLIRRRR